MAWSPSLTGLTDMHLPISNFLYQTILNFNGNCKTRRTEQPVIMVLAHIALIIHFCIVVFIISDFFLIPMGHAANWSWTSNVKFTISHCALMMFLTLETLIGITCALTSLENVLRGITQSDSFIRFWIWNLIYWDLPPHIFFTGFSWDGPKLCGGYFHQKELRSNVWNIYWYLVLWIYVESDAYDYSFFWWEYAS